MARYRIKRFSKEEDNKNKGKVVAPVLGLLGAYTIPQLSKLSRNDLHESFEKGATKIEGMKDNTQAYNNLKKISEEQGIKIKEKMPESAYQSTNNPTEKQFRNKIAKQIKKARKTGDKQKLKKALDLAEVAEDVKKDRKSIKLKDKTATTLSHELGHAQYDRGVKGRQGGIIGTLAHDAYHIQKGLEKKKWYKYGKKAALIGDGFRRGKNSVETDEEGNIKTKKGKILKSAALGIATSSPALVAEAMASRKGLQLLKQSGASKELMKASRKQLAKAWGSYGAHSLKDSAPELVGHGLGVTYGQYREKKKNKNQKKSLESFKDKPL